MPLTASEAAILKGAIAILQSFVGTIGTEPHAAGVADDGDLDSQYGDPVVKFNPRDWHGSDCKGLNLSGCPPEFLDLLAGTFDYFAKKAEDSGETTAAGKPVAPYKRKDAARARGWARRIRAGWKPQAAPVLGEPGADPFLNSEFPPVTPLGDDEIHF